MATTHSLSGVTHYLPALKAIAILGSFISGGTMTTGYRLLPAVYPAVQASPRDAARQWEFFYNSMSQVVPLTDLTTFIVIGSIAYTEYKESPSSVGWKIWATAAGIMPVGWVYVRKVMLVPSNKLLSIANPVSPGADKNSGPVQQKTIELLKEFNSQMSFRMMFPWVVGGLALYATLGL